MKEVAKDLPELFELIPHIRGNIGLVFTNDNIREVRDVLVSFKVPAGAKTGTIAPADVFVPPGPTGMDPGQTAFFQSLGIATKIVRGTVEIISEVHLIKKGEKIGSSEVALLSKLNIRPFAYGFSIMKVYDTGSVYDPAVLDMSRDDLMGKFFRGLGMVAAVGLRLGIPSLATVPHSLINGFKKLVAVSVETNYDFPQAEKIKAYLADPSAFVVHFDQDEVKEANVAPAAVAAADEESEDEVGGGGGLFGGSDDGSEAGSD